MLLEKIIDQSTISSHRSKLKSIDKTRLLNLMNKIKKRSESGDVSIRFSDQYLETERNLQNVFLPVF